MSWDVMNEALRDRLHGTQTLTPTAEVLTAYLYAPGGRQDLTSWPYSFPLPAGREFVRWGGTMRKTTADVIVRIMLAPVGTEDMETLHKRYDAWCDALGDKFDTALAFDQSINHFDNQACGGLLLFDDIDRGWGFDMTFGTVDFDEIKELGG